LKRLGERIKRKREILRMQLNELATKVGVSSSALSQIERAKAFPSIVTLKSIADNLHTTVGELIGEHEALSSNPLMHFDDKSFVEENDSGCTSYLLSIHGTNKQMDTLLLSFGPKSNSDGIIKMHPGQTFLFVLSGELKMELEGTSYSLKRNDSFYLNANRAHRVENKSSKKAQMILVTTPPAD
jgi:transcriptional regulator with XRE-family HTH domain